MSRLETAKTKYPSIDWEVAKTADPSKNFKYLDWIGKNFANSSVDEFKSLLTRFEKFQTKLSEKDIAKYDVTSLKKTLTKIGPSNSEAKKAGVVPVETGIEGVELVLLESRAAVKAYTAGTKWCISQFNTFLNYAGRDNVYVATSNKTKLCFVGGLVYDASDREVSYMIGTGPKNAMNSFKLLYMFCNVKMPEIPAFSEVQKINKLCKAHGRRYRNVWRKLDSNNEKTFRQAYSKIAANGDVADILHAYAGPARLKIMQLCARDMEFYQKLIKIFSHSQNYMSYYYDNRYCYTTIARAWAQISKDEKQRQARLKAKKKFVGKTSKKLLKKKGTK